jgi:hypothetical protein
MLIASKREAGDPGHTPDSTSLEEEGFETTGVASQARPSPGRVEPAGAVEGGKSRLRTEEPAGPGPGTPWSSPWPLRPASGR